ncbi:MAG: hypothetical protein KY469_04845 [Actinobacteria bacterium]|nr:hypothetical protein [Actinomycetota bacterium]
MAADARPGYRAALRHPAAVRLWVAATASVVGDYVGQGALLILAFDRSGGRILGPAGLFAVTALPALLSGGLAGGWLDQIPRRTALVTLHTIGAGLIVLPLFDDGLAIVFVAAALLGAVRAATVAVRAGALAEGVPTELRGPTLALMNVSEQVSQVIGYLAGATIAVTIGAGPSLVGDAISFGIAALIVASIPFPAPTPRARRPPPTAGLRAIFQHPVLRLLAPLVWVTAAVGALPEVLAAPATASDPGWTPLVLAAGPAGTALTMLVVGRLSSVTRPSLQLIHFIWLGIALGLAALAPNAPTLALANIAVGSGVAWIIGPQVTFVQVAPAERMAQISGTMLAIGIAGEGLGSLLLATIADRTSFDRAYWWGGILVFVAAVIGWIIKERTPETRELDGLPVSDPAAWTAQRPRPR